MLRNNNDDDDQGPCRGPHLYNFKCQELLVFRLVRRLEGFLEEGRALHGRPALLHGLGRDPVSLNLASSNSTI